MATLAHDIALRAHTLDGAGLEAVLKQLGISGWLRLVQELDFVPWDTGGGCMMLVAELPGTGGHQVGVTDGDADLPTDANTFWLGVLDPDGEELYTLFVTGSQPVPSLPG